jgi:hypothetical protein
MSATSSFGDGCDATRGPGSARERERKDLAKW